MRSRAALAAFALALVALVALAGGVEYLLRRPGALAPRMIMPAQPSGAAPAPLLYADGQLSLNDRCAVRGGVLTPRVRPVYVNGRPIGFC